MQLGADLELAWSHPAATAATRKRILRTALNEMDIADGGIDSRSKVRSTDAVGCG
jgi:hypothetical protein